MAVGLDLNAGVLARLGCDESSTGGSWYSILCVLSLSGDVKLELEDAMEWLRLAVVGCGVGEA